MRYLRRILLVTAALLAPVLPARADSTDDFLKAQMAARHIPGLSVAVVQDGAVVKAAAYGVSDVAAKTPATLSTRFILGSCTKPFTAVAVLQLQEAGKVDLDASASRYLPGLPAAWIRITVRQLLTHTSGLPNYREFLDYNTLADPNYVRPNSVTALLAGKTLHFAPGTKFEYSNTNYHLLGQIIEKVSGQSYEAYLATHQFHAAGMTATGLATGPAPLPGQAAGYNWNGTERVVNKTFLPRALDFGDDGLMSTAGDLAKWTTALSAGRLVSAATLKQMITPGRLPDSTPTSYGFGFVVAPYRGQALVTHTGATPGYAATIAYFMDSRLAVVVLCNLFDQADPELTQPLALGVAKQFLPAPPAEAAVLNTDPQTAALLKTVSAQIASGTLDHALFAPALRDALTPAAVGPAHALLAPLGPLTSLSLLRRDPASGLAKYRALYGTTAVVWLIAVDKDHKITALRPVPE